MKHRDYARKGFGLGHKSMSFKGFIGGVVEVYKKIRHNITSRIPQYLINLKKRF